MNRNARLAGAKRQILTTSAAARPERPALPELTVRAMLLTGLARIGLIPTAAALGTATGLSSDAGLIAQNDELNNFVAAG